MIQPSGSGSFFGEIGLLRLAEVDEANEAAKVPRPEKSLLRTSESSRTLLYFDVLRKKYFFKN
jgi:hypothetical protein